MAGREAEQSLSSSTTVKLNGSTVQFHPIYDFIVCTGKRGRFRKYTKTRNQRDKNLVISVLPSFRQKQLGLS